MVIVSAAARASPGRIPRLEAAVPYLCPKAYIINLQLKLTAEAYS
jgi:hypothetical protein